MNMSVCVIVKNEEKNIERCLSSIIKSGVNVIVVDTGSSDNTKGIARKYTEYIYDYEWNGDFGAAKQFAVSKALYDNILILDSDEYLISDIHSLSMLVDELTNLPDRVGRIRCVNLMDELDETVYNNAYARKNREWINRAFNRKFFHISGKIHEQIVSNDDKEYNTFYSSVVIEHTGYALTEDEKENKIKRNLSMLKERLYELEKEVNKSDNDETAYVLYQIGKTYYMGKDYNNANKYFEKALSYDLNPKLEYVINMVNTYGYSLINSGRQKDALAYECLYDTFGNNADYEFLMGLIYMKNGLLDKAIEKFLKALNYNDCTVEGVNSYLAYYNIGVIYECLGFSEKAVDYYRKCGGYDKAILGIQRCL